MAKATESQFMRQIRAAWLSAQTEPFLVDCPTVSSARRIRFQCYNAVRDVRKNPALNPELAAALEVVQISIEPHANGFRLRMGKSTATDALTAAFAERGITGAEAPRIQDQEGADAAESLQRLQQRLNGDASAGHVPNKYYSR